MGTTNANNATKQAPQMEIGQKTEWSFRFDGDGNFVEDRKGHGLLTKIRNIKFLKWFFNRDENDDSENCSPDLNLSQEDSSVDIGKLFAGLKISGTTKTYVKCTSDDVIKILKAGQESDINYVESGFFQKLGSALGESMVNICKPIVDYIKSEAKPFQQVVHEFDACERENSRKVREERLSDQKAEMAGEAEINILREKYSSEEEDRREERYAKQRERKAKAKADAVVDAQD